MNAKDRPVNGPDGFYGTVDITCWPGLDAKTQTNIDLHLRDGSHVMLPAESLIEQKDGSYYVPMRQDQINAIPHHLEPDRGIDRQIDGGVDRGMDGRTWPCEECEKK